MLFDLAAQYDFAHCVDVRSVVRATRQGAPSIAGRAPDDDLLDATSRIFDMEIHPPEIINEADCYPEVFSDGI
jgi:hypothetical protein